MRDGAPTDVLAGAFRWRPSLSSWLGTVLLAEEVPVVDGRLSVDGTAQIPERLTFTVPEFAATEQFPDGFRWVPDSPEHPLSHHGQFVDVDIHVWSSVTAAAEDAEPTATTRLGRFQVQDWSHDDLNHTVDVECVGLLWRAQEAQFRTPQSPRPTGTLASEFARLMVPGIPVSFDPALVDRPVPQSFQWDEDRIKALYEICDAWPARMVVDQFGTLRVLPGLPEQVPDPVLSFVDGERGTLISAPQAGTRDGIANVVVARSSETDSPAKAPLQAVAEVTYGPLAPATYGEVVEHWSSPLANTIQQLQASANTIRDRKMRPALVQRVVCVPDPRVEVDDAALLERGRHTLTRTVPANALPGIDGGSPSTSSFVDSLDGGSP